MKVLLKKGAEASLYLTEWFGRKALAKVRHPKRYRLPALDRAIRESRTTKEARTMVLAKKLGVPTPPVFEVDRASSTIVMGFVEGTQLKEVIDSWPIDRCEQAFRRLGEYVGALHEQDLVHGDLTTSNVIVGKSLGELGGVHEDGYTGGDVGPMTLVDFGLSEATPAAEAKAVEVHLLKRVLVSTHGRVWEPCLSAFIEGYSAKMGSAVNDVVSIVSEIETRGRYIEKERRRSR
ncbi:MAG: KEOPS complex kinase/ATPase Bud32 [Promethearchaeota archaeon]